MKDPKVIEFSSASYEGFNDLRIDEKPAPNAYATEIGSGEYKGTWLFTSRMRAEEFCWKRGLTPKFDEPEQTR